MVCLKIRVEVESLTGSSVTVDIEPHTGNVWNMLIGPSS